jgi:alkylation response protein AidB-like acyl-CoA dehydrogenase
MQEWILPILELCAKLYASEIALEVANEAVQIHGGNGVAEYVERMMRFKITKFTRELNVIVISRGLRSNLIIIIKALSDRD